MFVREADSPTNDTLQVLNLGNSCANRFSSKLFTCPYGGFFLPHVQHVVRPTRISWLYGVPISKYSLETRLSSEHALSSNCEGMCSSTSAQSTRSYESSLNSKLVTSP